MYESRKVSYVSYTLHQVPQVLQDKNYSKFDCKIRNKIKQKQSKSHELPSAH